MTLKPFPLSRVYGLLEPGPVVLVTTRHRGRSNVMTLSWHLMMDFEPPLIGMVLSEGNHSFKMLEGSGECVIAVPTVEWAKTLVGIGNCTGRDTDKFERFGLKTLPAKRVGAPLLPGCWANIECVVADRKMARRYNFFVLKALAAWTNPSVKDPRTLHHRGNGVFMVAGKTLRLPSRMK